MVELLAPVGSKDALIAAVESGANAVYLAGKMFGARAYAANFTQDELVEAIQFAHRRDVLVDVAVNTVVDNSEFEELAEYLRFLYHAGADAIIVQDLGVAKLAREIVPDLPLHASTQMTVHNIEGVRFLKELGFTRVVLSRELSIEDIQYICQNIDIEIEVFIHGALCICYSGQCLMSGMIGGRSGNRGRCAQPCRLPYTLVDGDGNNVLAGGEAGEYLLSPKDLNTIDLLPELIEAGVDSLKIEGRMKRPEYVAVVVDTYRRAVDSYLANKNDFVVDLVEKKELAQIFNRDFTEAYMKKRPGKFMMSDRRPNNRGVLAGRVEKYDAKTKLVTIKLAETLNQNDIVEFWVKVGGRVSATVTTMYVEGKEVTSALPNQKVSFAISSPVRDHDRAFKVFDAQLMERARSFFNQGAPLRRYAIDVKVTVSIGSPLKIEIVDEEGFFGNGETDFVAEKALKRPLTEETIKKQIDRMGTTVFALRKLTCNIIGEVMVPMSEINEARRKAVEELEKARMIKFVRPESVVENNNLIKNILRNKKRNHAIKPQLVVNVDTIEKVRVAIENGADIILFGGDNFQHSALKDSDYHKAYLLAKEYNKKIVFNTPQLLKQWQMKGFISLIESFKENLPDAIAVNNIGTLHMIKNHFNVPLQADYHMNVYNNLAIELLASRGVETVTLSPELNFSQIEQIADLAKCELECLVHGNLSLMVSEYCAMGSFLGNLDKGACSKPCLKESYFLSDRKDEKFPLVTDQYCRMHVLNGKELSMFPHVPRLSAIGIHRLRIEGKYMTPAKLAKITRLYREFIELGEEHPLFKEDKMDAIEKNITRGHYFRGVL
ncbi:DUF3656 domain-containing U32 family peptidase [Anaerosinus gibii]|uniref:DUF3656 domain-containing protein n=1 Tax=Selenobaculum gibii TaxID=3054208 RepID=A0A9Y2AKD3_9FIRM|nr:DUF3656 domain-containing protein [Selenobaculum gbiensis]WIW71756.1 DUF3656 domain-containing protein [Selenobaculum gbiensis]